MKTHLKISLLVALFISSFSVNAQKFAIEGGYTNPERCGNGISSTYLNGNRIGLTTKFKIKNNISLLTGALYTIAYGDKKQSYPNSKVANYYTYGQFIDVPVFAIYTQPIFKNVTAFIGGGPNLNIGLYQSQITVSDVSTIATSTKNLYHNGTLNRLNLQVGLTGGVQWKKYQLKTGYDWGVLNLNKVGENNIFQRSWNLSFAYEF